MPSPCFATSRASLWELSAMLGGLDTLIFTAGIGERAAPVRERISHGLGSSASVWTLSATTDMNRSSRVTAAESWFA
jgi:acetate kinase